MQISSSLSLSLTPAEVTARALSVVLPMGTTTGARERSDGERALLAAAPDERRLSLGAVFDGWVRGMGFANGKRACDERDLSAGCLEYMAGRSAPSFAPREIMRWVQDAERRRLAAEQGNGESAQRPPARSGLYATFTPDEIKARYGDPAA